MWKGTLISIHIAPEATVPLQSVTEVRAVAGKGLEGDRYFTGHGTWSTHPGLGREVTLIEYEAIEALERESSIVLAPAEARRNLVTRGAPLNHLVGREFRIGDVHLRGIRLCEPCKHLEGLTKPGAKDALLHRGGLRTEIVREGILRVGDPIEEV
jgi:MOSC domain-containing protein YiiM